MASAVDYSKYYYKWGSIRFRWLAFAESKGLRRKVDNYLGTFFTKPYCSPFLRAVVFDESTQLLVQYKDYIKMKTELEKNIDTELPKIGNTRLSFTNPVAKPVQIGNVARLKSVLRDINNANRALRSQQQRTAKENEQKVKEYVRANPTATFLIVDIEMYEHDHSYVTEIGFVVFQRNDYDKAEHFHYIIDENREYVNKDHVPDNRYEFKFGTSVVASLDESKAALKKQLERADAIIGHNIKEDEKILDGVPLVGKFRIDTQELAFAQASDPQPMSLKHILENHRVRFDENHLHNAGNDCHYTMIAFKELTRFYDQ